MIHKRIWFQFDGCDMPFTHIVAAKTRYFLPAGKIEKNLSSFATKGAVPLSNSKMMDDRVLVSEVLGGDRKAFVTLVKQHQRLVAHMVGRVVKVAEEREEICQDVFMRVYQKLGEFKFQSRLSTWIATIAYRQAINHLQKMTPHMLELPDDETYSTYFVEPDNPELVLEERDAEEVVLKLIDKLPAQYKMVISLYHIESMNYEEIGAITGMPEGTVKSYLFRARNMIKETVKKYLAKEELR